MLFRFDESFSGKIKKIRLVSNCICFGPYPEPEDEVEQHLTLNNKGQIWFSSFCFGQGHGKYEKCYTRRMSIDMDKAKYVLNAVASAFENFDPMIVTDVGTWDIEITDTCENNFKYTGSLYGIIDTYEQNLSDLIRDELQMPELLLFDGNNLRDFIERFSLVYHRHIVFKREPSEEGMLDELILDYSQTLIIDREQEHIENKIKIGSECIVTHTYYVGDGVSDLLDRFNVDNMFLPVLEAPDDVIEDENDKTSYIARVEFNKKPDIVLNGVYDKYGLPENWAEIIDEIWDFIIYYGLGGDIFNPKIYRKIRRRVSDLIFLYVEFGYGGKEYCYLAQDDEYFEGDLVDVPVGDEGKIIVAEVTRVVYLPAEEAPYPIDKIKQVIGKHKRENN